MLKSKGGYIPSGKTSQREGTTIPFPFITPPNRLLGELQETTAAIWPNRASYAVEKGWFTSSDQLLLGGCRMIAARKKDTGCLRVRDGRRIGKGACVRTRARDLSRK